MEGSLDTARRFARALDAQDYDTVATCLSSTCEYAIRDKIARGRSAIIASYREAASWAASTLESARYENDVRSESGAVVITFFDHLAHRGNTLTHRCEQRLEFDDAGQICRIVHVDLAGEREALEAFLEHLGISGCLTSAWSRRAHALVRSCRSGPPLKPRVGPTENSE
jgi:hypothetical protein